MTIDQLAEKRKKGVEALRENNWEEGIKDLLSDLYPDTAHFIYELLQNAEDAEASEVRFSLTNCSVEFEHNGKRLFSLEDVKAITNIGGSPKRDDRTSIGKFGIGFKAVFTYTSTPEIESGEYHFCIRDMFVPDMDGLRPASVGEGKTRFVFPFDNPKRSPEKARQEIENNLRELDESTLLFLSNIGTIKYELPNLATGYLKRKAIDGNRIEISVKGPDELAPESSHYLLFDKNVTVEDADEANDCRIAVAFGMKKPKDEGWKIVPLNPGQVCIYFPAAKETSGLRFHLHAPFASTVARDSVQEDSANNELLKHLADLVAESMSTIREQGLLDIEFLALLPNETDDLSCFYLPIQERLAEAFKQEKLTPTRQSNHAPASGLYRGRPEIINLIKDNDLATLLGRGSSAPLWVANPQLLQRRDERGRYVQDADAQRQNERIRNFLNMLEITEWTTEDFIEVLEVESERGIEWLKGKSDAWHQQLYVLLGDYLSGASNSYYEYQRKQQLCGLQIVRCSDGMYRIGSECHFLSNDMEDCEDLLNVGAGLKEGNQPEIQVENEYEEDFHYVAEGVYASGLNPDEKPQKFLKTIGVREVNEKELVKMILKQRYAEPSKPREADMERFIKFVETNPNMAKLFESYLVFHIDKDLDNESSWACPSDIYLDAPYLETGLKAYQEVFDEDSEGWKWPLSPKYVQSGVNLERLAKFAKAVGAKTQLEPDNQRISHDHPEYQNLVENALGQWRSDYGTNEDYAMPEFKVLLDLPSIDKARLIWRTMCSLPKRCLKAVYQSNRSHAPREGHSSLVHELRKVKWVPQKNGDSTSFERPCDASMQYLIEGFQYDTGQVWLKAIEFGKTTIERETEYNQLNQHAREMGFASVDQAEKMAELANALGEQGRSIEYVQDLVKEKVREERRKELLIIDLSDADEKQYEIRALSIRTTRSIINPKTHLRALYTTEMNNVECQMCRQGMPFEKRNRDEDYFEAVEALGKKYFPKEHEAQYLALCPTCAAKYKEYVKRNKQENAQEKLHRVLKDSDVPEVLLELSDFVIRIQFTEKHWQDLKTVVFYYENLYGSES